MSKNLEYCIEVFLRLSAYPVLVLCLIILGESTRLLFENHFNFNAIEILYGWPYGNLIRSVITFCFGGIALFFIDSRKMVFWLLFYDASWEMVSQVTYPTLSTAFLFLIISFAIIYLGKIEIKNKPYLLIGWLIVVVLTLKFEYVAYFQPVWLFVIILTQFLI